ncbi:FAD-binding oxidoreductase [Nonomuraea rubra]|uniref:FAD-binding oxidoreductase n=1 Tax=Nonomuraea rubra TaxID=46180 RepID=UPI003606B491
MRPRWVALPETVGEIAAVLRAGAEQDLAVVPTGGGTKLHWGPPPERCDVLLDLCCMNEILEHAAGDLVVRAQAGVTMDALAGMLAAKGQELALDVPFTEGTTVGGTLAASLPGPRSFRYGTARDLLIGITVVLPDGTIACSGGKVVKNVAGYDLGKLFTGSYGTLGVIAEATFRLHPLPADRRWVVAELDRAEVAPVAARLAASQAEPSAVEVDWPDPGGPHAGGAGGGHGGRGQGRGAARADRRRLPDHGTALLVGADRAGRGAGRAAVPPEGHRGRARRRGRDRAGAARLRRERAGAAGGTRGPDRG